MLYKSRLKKIEEEKEKNLYVVEENGKKVADPKNPTLPANRIANKIKQDKTMFDDIAPIKTKTSTTKGGHSSGSGRRDNVALEEQQKKKSTWFQSGSFEDGYQFGDLSKGIFGTLLDVREDVGTGLKKMAEGVVDTGAYLIGGGAKLVGQDEFAEGMKKFTARNLSEEYKHADAKIVDAILGTKLEEASIKSDKDIEGASVLGEKSDNLVQSASQLAGTIGLQAVGVPWWLTTGTTTFGGEVENAFNKDATYEEAGFSALVSTGAEILTEKISGGISFGGKTLDAGLKRAITERISSKAASNITKYGIDMALEGGEEVASEFFSTLGRQLSYEKEETWETLLNDEQAMDQYINQVSDALFGEQARENYRDAFIGGAVISGGFNASNVVKSNKTGRDIETGYTQNEQTVIDNLVNEQTNTIAKQNTLEKELNKAIAEKEAEQGGILSAKEKNALKEQISTKIESGEIDISSTKVSNKEIETIRKAVEEQVQKGQLDTNKIESILGNTITENDSFLARSYQETARKRENFTYDNTKITNENEKAVYDSATKYFNNTTRSHEFVEKVAKISKDKGTKYGFINNEELQSLGHDVEGKQVNGLVRTTQDGKQTVLINVDSPKALNTIVGHETTHLLEGTQEYNELQDVIFNYAKEKGDFDSRKASLNELYDGIKNANIDAEITADLVGDYLFTDEKFINSLSTQKPGLFQKIKTLIDDLVVKFTGTKEEKALREVQKKFKEAYRKNATDTNAATNEIQYSISENVETMTEDDAIDTMKHLSDIEKTRELTGDEKDLRQDIINKYLLKSDKFSDYLRGWLNEKHSKDNIEIEEKTRNEINIKKYDTKQSDIQGLENYKESDIENAILQDIDSKLAEYGYGDEDIEIDSIYLHGSRKRGTAKTDSDLDVVLFYNGEADDVGLFNDLNENRLNIDGIEIDVNPINLADESAESYIARSEAYDKEVIARGGAKYSLTDNQGRNLSEYTLEKTKNSKVRDENGNLMLMYHGSPDGSYTQLKAGTYFTSNKEYAERYTSTSASSLGNGRKTINNPKIYEAYLNIEKPFNLNDPEARNIYINDYVKGGNALGINPYLSDAEYNKIDNIDWTEVEDLKDFLQENGYDYDGIIADEGGDFDTDGNVSLRGKSYIPFSEEQIIKANEGNTKYSLSNFNEQKAVARGNYNVYGEDIKYQEAIAPLQEEIQTLTETVNELKEQIAPTQETVQEVEYTQPTKAELDNLETLRNSNGTEYAREFFNLRNKYGQVNLYKGLNQYKTSPDTYEAPIKNNSDVYKANTESDLPMLEQQSKESFDNINESDIPTETENYIPDGNISEPKSLFETRDYEEVGNRNVNAYQYDHPEVKPYFQPEAQAMLNDLQNSIKGERMYNDELYYSSGGEQGYFGTQRQTTQDIAELLDGMDGKYKYTYADIEKGLNAIIKDEGAENNAVSKRIELYLDQRLRNGYTTVDGIEVPANQDYIDTMKAIEINDYYNNIPIDDSMVPVENVSNSDNLVPIMKQKAEKTVQYETIRPQPDKDTHGYTLKRVTPDPTYDEIAEVLDTEPKTENQRNKRKWAIFKANAFDKGAVFEDVSLKNKNRELMGKWDYTLTSEARGQNVIGQGHYEYDPISKSTKQVSKSLNDIRAEVENTGLTKEFYEYMYHKHNYDRMNLQERYGEENKPVFGYNVTALDSQIKVLQYESQHPEFMDYAQDVYDYLSADRQQLVKEGVISQETADLWQDMYPHYVPIRRVDSKGLNIDVPLDTGRTSVNAPIKRATGGNTDILPLFDTMAQRTLQTYRATAKNSFGIELMNTLGTRVDKQATSIDDVIDSIDSQESLLQEGKNGKKPTFTVFENGEKVTFEITEDMYDALKPLSDSSILSKTIKPLNAISNFHRGVLTEYNPVFMLTNAIKDSQDILINSQHAAKTYSKIPEAFTQLVSKGYWYQEYIANGGEQNSYFDSQENTFKTENKGLKKILDLPPLSTISKLNNFIEMTPRLAEYIASRESGRSVEVSMLDAARVTTNFKAGGNLTKFANRNGATFLNASVQGAMQQIRNIREAKANGVRGWMNLATKFAIAGLPAVLLNSLLWDDDDDYEELSDYIKQNYYIIWKDDNGNFIRIPKGRTLAVIQEGIQQMSNAITGDDEVDLKSFIDLALNNLAPNNPIENNVFSPITQVATNKAWYGGDLVPKRLQDLPASEQYDESTDMFSRWLGEVLNVSPYKVNYLLDQYTGGLGDVVLPMITPEAKSDADTLGEQLLAPLKSKFTANATMNNKNVGDLYDTSEKLTTEAKKNNATDNDVLSNKYINSVKAEMNELYKQKRETQNSDLSNSEKYNKVKEIQAQINELAKEGLNNYEEVKISGNYATVGDRQYKIGSDGEWEKITDKQLEKQNEVTSYLNIEPSEYWSNKEEYDYAYENPGKYQTAIAITDYKTYQTYRDKINDLSADKDEDGKSISGSRKSKVISYVNSLDLTIPQKAMLIRQSYSSFDDYNNEIVDYVSGLEISYEEKINLLKSLDMEVDAEGNVRW
jgi:hypothetical protein